MRCYLQRLSRRRARVWMNAEGEALVLQGTACLADDPGSEVLSRVSPFQPAAVRVLSRVAVGNAAAPLEVRIDAADVDARLPFVTEPLPCYREADQFGARVAPPSLAVHAMRRVERELTPPQLNRLAVCGGIEYRNRDGPVYCDRDYRLQGRVVAISASRDTEKLWYQADLYDLRNVPVATLVKMERIHVRDAPGVH